MVPSISFGTEKAPKKKDTIFGSRMALFEFTEVVFIVIRAFVSSSGIVPVVFLASMKIESNDPLTPIRWVVLNAVHFNAVESVVSEYTCSFSCVVVSLFSELDLGEQEDKKLDPKRSKMVKCNVFFMGSKVDLYKRGKGDIGHIKI